jgi:hypothetical protein
MLRRLIPVFMMLGVVLLPMGIQAQDTQMIGPYTYPEGVSPLTGQPVLYPEALQRRPLNIKITNWPPIVHPQSGLNSADIVWEHLVEGGVTRFTGVFYSEPVPHIGPVRSARLVDIELTHIYNSLFVHSGSSRGTLDRLRDDAVMPSRNFGGGPCPPLCRFPREDLAYEHTLYADTEDLYARADEIGLDTTPTPITGMAFSETPPDGGTAVNGINVAYRHTEIEWAYDELSQRWLRSQDDAPHFDAYSGSQVQASNILILEADHIEQPVVSEGYWGAANYAFEVKLVGGGRIYLFRDGQYYEGVWGRADDNSPLLFYDLQGNTLPFKPGRTFVNLVPRWENGYQLTFLLTEPVPLTVAQSSVLLHSGPGEGYQVEGNAAQGEILSGIGQNAAGNWIEVLLNSGDALWVSTDVVSFGANALQGLPVPRSTFEG